MTVKYIYGQMIDKRYKRTWNENLRWKDSISNYKNMQKGHSFMHVFIVNSHLTKTFCMPVQFSSKKKVA